MVINQSLQFKEAHSDLSAPEALWRGLWWDGYGIALDVCLNSAGEWGFALCAYGG